MESNNVKNNILLLAILALSLAVLFAPSTTWARSKVVPTKPKLHTITGKVDLVDHGRIVVDDFSFQLPPGTSGIAPGDHVEMTFDNSGKIMKIKKTGTTQTPEAGHDTKAKTHEKPPEKTSKDHHPGHIRKEGGKWKNY